MAHRVEWLWGTIGTKPEGSWSFGDPNCKYFDLASVTKALVAPLMVLDFADKKKLPVSTFIATRLSEFSLGELGTWPSYLGDCALEQLLEHRCGIRAHRWLFGKDRIRGGNNHQEALAFAAKSILEEDLIGVPNQTVYSDFGHILWTYVFEHHMKTDLATWWRTRFRLHEQNSSLASALFPNFVLPGEERAHESVPTEQRHLPGEVNDDNTYGLWNQSAHAGLFGSAQGLWDALGLWWLELKRHSDWEPLMHKKLLRPKDCRFSMGLDTCSGAKDSSAGFPAPKQVVGHLGYSGTAFWFDMDSGRMGVLLTNRVCPQPTPESKVFIARLRNVFFSKLWQTDVQEGSWAQWHKDICRETGVGFI